MEDQILYKDTVIVEIDEDGDEEIVFPDDMSEEEAFDMVYDDMIGKNNHD